jgi:DhnA family fructose-bisphosphate aldolase class Ia
MLFALGKTRRLRRMTPTPSRRMAGVALDHGMQVGPIAGIEDMGRVIDIVARTPVDAVIVNPGVLQRYGDRLADGPAVILRLDQTTMWRMGSPTGYADSHTRLVASVEEAVAMGAEAVITYLFLCNRDPELESRSVEITGAVAQAARQFGIVHMVEAMGVFDGIVDRDDPGTIAFATRIAGEMGADVIKTNWSGSADSFRSVVDRSIVPVVVAGGPRLDGDEAVAAYTDAVVASGAMGIMFGRNVFQSPDPVALLTRICDRLHA